jgi:hypothetical protein
VLPGNHRTGAAAVHHAFLQGRSGSYSTQSFTCLLIRISRDPQLGSGAGAASQIDPRPTQMEICVVSSRSIAPARWFSVGAAGLVLALVLALALPYLPAFAAATTIATDPYTQATCAASAATNHHTIVEPDTFSNGSTIVAAYQVGRIYDGGACATGFATSTNNGATWTTGLLPGITKWSGSGPNDRATDPSVAYNARYNVWPVSSLTLLEAGGVHGNSVVTSRSTDGGFTWGNPVTTATGADLDKNWIVCDNTASSPFCGN